MYGRGKGADAWRYPPPPPPARPLIFLVNLCRRNGIVRAELRLCVAPSVTLDIAFGDKLHRHVGDDAAGQKADTRFEIGPDKARSGVTVTRPLCDPLPYKNVLKYRTGKKSERNSA
jgi:hypothetical protein